MKINNRSSENKEAYPKKPLEFNWINEAMDGDLGYIVCIMKDARQMDSLDGFYKHARGNLKYDISLNLKNN